MVYHLWRVIGIYPSRMAKVLETELIFCILQVYRNLYVPEIVTDNETNKCGVNQLVIYKIKSIVQISYIKEYTTQLYTRMKFACYMKKGT